jgi:hypothetical protein
MRMGLNEEGGRNHPGSVFRQDPHLPIPVEKNSFENRDRRVGAQRLCPTNEEAARL